MIDIKNKLPDTAAPFADIETALECVWKVFSGELLGVPDVVRGYTEYLTRSKGKHIRAYSLLTCAQDNNGLIHPDAVKIAAAVEMLHLATLVHDDVIDDACTRRGEESLQKKFGKKTAVICGDYLFCLSLKLASYAAQTRAEKGLPSDINIIPDYMTQICRGELRQHINNRNYNLTGLEYLKIIGGKTAALFEACFYSGFNFSGEPAASKKLYRRLGRYIGMIFQLTDDCADYILPQEQTKKTVRSDFEQGVITLPLIFAFKKNPQLKKLAQNNEITPREIVSNVIESGGLDHARGIAEKYRAKAQAIIMSMDIAPQKKDRLASILRRSANGIKL